MKLLIFICDLAGGGAERVTATLSNYWARRQWDITIVTLGPQTLDFYSLDPAIKRISLDMAGDSGNLVSAIQQNWDRVATLRKVIKQLQPDVALSMMSTSNVMLALAATGLPNLCVLGAEHCYPPNFPLGRAWTMLRRFTYSRLSAVVALTSECAAWIENNTSARHVPVIPNAATWPLPVKQPQISPSAVCPAERKVLLAVGRLSKEKQFDLLIDVFSQLAPKHADWDLVILGDGAERPHLESRVPNNMLGKRIFIPGIAGNVGEWYERADLYVMSSKFEGFPNALAEALAHGLPAISFDCDTGPRDIIRHGIDGLLVPPKDILGMHDALDKVMGDPALRASLASQAIEARSRFSIERVAGMWEQLFKQLSGSGMKSSVSLVKTVN